MQNGFFWAVAYSFTSLFRVMFMIIFMYMSYPIMRDLNIHWFVIILLPVLFGVWPYVGLRWMYLNNFITMPMLSGRMVSLLPWYLLLTILEYITDYMMCSYFSFTPSKYKNHMMIKFVKNGLNMYLGDDGIKF